MVKEILLTQGKSALVDDADYTELSKYKWCAIKKKNAFYAMRKSPVVDGKDHSIHMHAVIAGTPKGFETDHINGDGLDNRRENLRIVTTRQNQQNRHHTKSSRFPGVTWDRQTSKWKSAIRINGKSHNLGRFEDENTAGIIYAMACGALKMGVTV